MPTSQQDIEAALDASQIWAAMRNGRYWRLRRNGKTKLWKTRPGEFSIPVKAGMKSHTYLTDGSNIEIAGKGDWRKADFLISQDDPNLRAK